VQSCVRKIAALTVLVCALPTTSKADIITCIFTEPFVTTVFSMAQNTLTIHSPTEGRETVLRNVSFQIMGAAVFELWGSDRQLVQRLRLSHDGSDGMSDRKYPYAVEWGEKNLQGGCTSLHLPTR
jgi:uncharacterized membrane protein